MTADKPFPTPEQVRAWLSTHGWSPEDPFPTDPEGGVDFTYKELSDDGQEIWVRAPLTEEATPRYPLRVQDIIVTAAGMEDRSEADVLAEMLATDPNLVPVPRTPPAPAA